MKQGATLRVSFVGCKPADVKWEGQHLNVTLQDDGQTLDEVVVVGFGQQKKANLTGAVATVTGKEIAARPVNTVADALQGMAAGLDVLGAARGGQLGATRSMNIRGTGTIGSGSSVSPLVLIDGMEGDINQLNPADVENVSILKDAAASSIYGSRAAGGVILITTRQGKEGKVTVNYSDSFRWSKALGLPKFANSWEWAVTMNEAAANNGSGWFSQAYLDKLKAVVDDPSLATMFVNPTNNHWEVWDETDILPIANTDWMEEHFGTTPFAQEHNLSVTGGTDKYNYYFSGNILSQDGTLRYGKDNLQRYTLNAKINVAVTNWLTFGYSARWYRGHYDAPSFVREEASNEMYHNIARYWPIIPTHDPNGFPVVESFINAMVDASTPFRTNSTISSYSRSILLRDSTSTPSSTTARATTTASRTCNSATAGMPTATPIQTTPTVSPMAPAVRAVRSLRATLAPTTSTPTYTLPTLTHLPRITISRSWPVSRANGTIRTISARHAMASLTVSHICR